MLVTVAVALAILLGTTFGPAAGTHAVGAPNQTLIEQRVHHLANEERVARGLAPLALNDTLARMAREHSTWMAREGTFGHGDEPLSTRYARYGLECNGAENIYAVATVGAPYDEGALARRTVTAWLDSTGHRENLLGDRFIAHGVGVATDTGRGRTTIYVTQDFC